MTSMTRDLLRKQIYSGGFRLVIVIGLLVQGSNVFASRYRLSD